MREERARPRRERPKVSGRNRDEQYHAHPTQRARLPKVGVAVAHWVSVDPLDHLFLAVEGAPLTTNDR